jgi:hypothetical protein
LNERRQAMGPELVDAAMMLKIYQAFLAALVWLLAAFACLTVFFTGMFLWRERTALSNRPASPCIGSPNELGVGG